MYILDLFTIPLAPRYYNKIIEDA